VSKKGSERKKTGDKQKGDDMPFVQNRTELKFKTLIKKKLQKYKSTVSRQLILRHTLG
jgi:hypothetical protein